MIADNQSQKTTLEIITTGIYGCLLAIAFQIIRASREHVGEPFNAKSFLIGLISAGGVGAIVAWTLDSIGINRELNAVIISMAGYVGGPLLDICYQEIQETLQAGFDGIQKWLNEGKWGK